MVGIHQPAKKSNKQSKDDKAGGKKKTVKVKASIINFQICKIPIY